MEQKRVSFKVAKALKEAGYWDPNTTLTSQYNNPCYAKNEKLYENGCICDWEDVFPAPTYLDVWLWLCREKGKDSMTCYFKDRRRWSCWITGMERTISENDPEEAIIAAIDYLVDNDLIK